MSTDPDRASLFGTPEQRRAGCRTLGEYIQELVRRLGDSEPEELVRLRKIVGSRRARITLDDEVVEVWMERGSLVVDLPSHRPVQGEGTSSRFATLDLLDGYLEVADAILDGWIEAIGTIEDVSRMLQSIEILLDVSVRSPAMQALARDYRADPCRAPRLPASPRDRNARRRLHFDDLREDERALLSRLDLLP